MFVSTKDQGSLRRRGRPSGISKTARVSKLSLLSTVTGASSGSSGSTSTVTQDSFSRDRTDQPKKRIRRRRPRETSDDDMHDLLDTPGVPMAGRDSVDVFKFLVEDQLNNREGDVVDEAHPVQLPDFSGIHEDFSDPECYYRSHLSDSGISMGSNSAGEPSHFEAYARAPLPPLIEETPQRRHSFSHTLPESPSYQTDFPTIWTGREAYDIETLHLNTTNYGGFPLPPEYNPAGTSSRVVSSGPLSACIGPAPLSFKEDVESPCAIPPVVRSFARVNARLLLQMQSNIADIEHELCLLDAKALSEETLAKQKKSRSGKPNRHVIKMQGKRTYLYQELHRSLDQYYKLLVASQCIQKGALSPDPIKTAELESWLRSYISPASKLLPLIGDGTDLIELKSNLNEKSNTDFRLLATSILLIDLLPLFVFKFICGVLNRLILLSLFLSVGAFAMGRAGIKLDGSQRNCILAFACISTGAALLL